jgi:hypothetical protein
MFDKIKKYRDNFIIFLVLSLFGGSIYYTSNSLKEPGVLKEYKDGIQNHLVWSIKGECYFVRPGTDPSVNLIRVVDCDRK